MGLALKDDEANKIPKKAPKASTLEAGWAERRLKVGVEGVEADAEEGAEGAGGEEGGVGVEVEVREDQKGQAKIAVKQAELNSVTLFSCVVLHSSSNQLLLYYKFENWENQVSHRRHDSSQT